MSSDPDSEDEGYSPMELPTLIKQLRSVLDQYPDDGQILKELIQNAEDAEASEVKILFDGRNIQPQVNPKLLRRRKYLASLRAPALCVHNDALFTKEDWTGIKMLHQSIKEEEPLKVGRFGLGFKSVFHVTDFPCILSGSTVLFLNPHDRNSSRVCYMKNLCDLDKDTRNILGQVINGTFDFSSDASSYNGTLFWFPLRSQGSDLSDNLYSEKKTMDLFEAFKAEASMTLLFLKFIEKIHLFQRITDSPQILFTVQLSQNCLQMVRAVKTNFIKEVKEQNGRIPAASIETKLILDITLNDWLKGNTEHQKWLVVNFYKGGHISEKLRDLNSDTSLSYCPYVGVAVPLGRVCQGHVFCFLPLPRENRSCTGLTVHVNGFFALSQNRRYVKWPTADQQHNQAHTDKAIEWNKCLVKEVLPEVYCHMLKEVIECCKQHGNPDHLQKQVYSLVPALSDIDSNWQPLIESVLKQSFTISFLFTPTSGGMWIQVQDGILLDNESEFKDMIAELFTLYNRNIVLLPPTLLSTLQEAYGTDIRKVSKMMVWEILKSENKYTCLPKEKKLVLLRYLAEYKYLIGIRLLPLADGTFAEFGAGDVVYICDNCNDIQTFPGLERRFVAVDIPSDLRDTLQTIASQGVPSLASMSSAAFPHLLQQCLSQHFPGGTVELPSAAFTVSWLRQVWKYISKNSIDVETHFVGIPLIPDIDQRGHGRLHSVDNIFIAQSMPSMESISELVCHALKKLGVLTFAYIPDFVLELPKIHGTVIRHPTLTGVLKTLDDVQAKSMKSSVSNFNTCASKQEREGFVHYLSSVHILSSGAEAVLKKLEIFTDTNGDFCCIESVNLLAPEEYLPVSYPERYIYGSIQARQLSLVLGAAQQAFDDVCLQILKIMNHTPNTYSQDQKQIFMEFITKQHQSYFHRADMKQLASGIPFLKSIRGKSGLRAPDLFDTEDPILKSLFLEEDKFPDSKHVQSAQQRTGLKLIGLKTQKDVSEADIVTVAAKVEELVNAGAAANAKQKMASLISLLDKHPYQTQSLSNLQYYKCIPNHGSRPHSYPTSLPFKGSSESSLFRSSELFSSKYAPVVGSVSHVACDLTDHVESILNLKTQPPVHLVIEHLRNVSEHYQSPEHPMYMMLLQSIYQFLSTFKEISCQEKDMMQNTRSVWAEDGFQYPKSVYIHKTDNDLDLKPYRYQLPLSLGQWTSFLCSSGCHNKQTPAMLVTVLQEIKEKHDNLKAKNTKSSFDVKQDLKLILQIIGVLKLLPEKPENIYLPIHQKCDDFLILLTSDQCTYCNADWLKDQTSDDTNEQDDMIKFVHADISETTAKLLGVCSLTDRVMDDTDDFNMDYHQSEPLTNRLKFLLREYTDGFSVPKELIQNADDAGATEVCFMYDERQNLNARKFLMHDGMSGLQGPAFWAYNNASFEERDFNNIIKLSGATKEEDTRKVGKFGLGFNSVYNLTDVPSFISENTVVIFDPHGRHLGRPGLKANLKSVKNQLMLRKMYGQFKPFEEVFGCHFSSQGHTRSICPGTLFRLPLRTPQQAAESDIKKLSYSKSEMERFLEVFVEGCGNLVLFTQNVRSVKFFHLSEDGNPKAPNLLVHVHKDIISQTVISPSVSVLTEQNVLSFADREWMEHAKNEKHITIQEKCKINRNIYESHMVKTGNIKTGLETVPWNITWVTGSRDSAKFAMSKKLKGLLPLAGVAVTLIIEGNSAFQLDKCPQGFYRQGHFFCFLPLPVKTPFPVHINGTFAVTSDRRHLCMKTEDDKMLLESEWNESLKKDAVSRAYVSALSELQVEFENIDAFYKLWPLCCEDPSVYSFYKQITEEDDAIFVVKNGQEITRSSFQNMKYLDQRLSTDYVIGDIAFKTVERFWESDSEHLVRIPKDVFGSFIKAGFERDLQRRCISRLEFYKTIFFPNISDPYWVDADRDKLTMYALMTEDTELHDLIKQVKCIPTRPSGTLKQPSELIHPGGQCARMFAEEDECFPQGDSLIGFAIPGTLKVLCHLGMVQDDFPGELLLERARSVIELHKNSSCPAFRRCKEIIQYISHTDYSSSSLSSKKRFFQYPDAVKDQLKDINFFPVLQRPTTWLAALRWKADGPDGPVLARAKDLYANDLLNIVGCTELVMDNSELQHVYNAKDILLKLGLKQKHHIDIETAASQIHHLAELLDNNSDLTIQKIATSMCCEIYEYLNPQCDEEDSSKGHTINHILGHQKVILIGNRMLYPHQVAFVLPHDLAPHLYRVEGTHERFRSLFSTLGVKPTFDMHDMLKILQHVTDCTGIEKLSEQNLQCFGRIASYLLELMQKQTSETNDFEINQIYLPDSNGYLHPANTLCLNDCDWVDDDGDTMNFLHPDIHQKVAKWFGVKGKREADLSNHITFPDCFSSFGQSEKLTTRLRRILSGYPCDVSVMKELLQNADDADATELMFIKDFRSLPTEKIFSDNWASLQGPALCVYNNSYFSDKDFAGIQNFGEGSKSDDPVKTGQYGVGFNAVYHFTDVPSFMTVGPTTEKTICALDPHVKYVPWATSKSPGGQINNLERIRGKYRDAFAGYLEGCMPLVQKGTLFRFPLRTRDMAEESIISKKEITQDTVSKLLDDFKTEMFDSLLFLHSVSKITIAHVTEDGDLVEEYWVESKMSDSDKIKQKGFLSHLRTQAENVKDHSTGIGIEDISPLEIQLSLSIKDSRSRRQQWLVVHHSGFTKDKELPRSLVLSWERGDIGLLPRGGVAAPIPSDATETSNDDFQGRAFCILPLPIKTGLPVHVNGHFALDHEARRNLWHGTDDYRCDWNRHTLEAIIIPAYISAIQAMKIELQCTKQMTPGLLQKQLDRYYIYFPDVSKSTDIFWKSMMQMLYSDIVNRKVSVFSVVKPTKGTFSDYPANKRETLMEKIIWVPVSVREGFPGYFNNLHDYFVVAKSTYSGSLVSPAQQFDRYREAVHSTQKKIRMLKEVLIDLNMKVIDAPERIHRNFVDSGHEDHVVSVTPECVIQFLKSHREERRDRCMMGILPKKINGTPLKTITTVQLLTSFITRADTFASEICELPLTVTLSEIVSVFNTNEPVIVTHYSDLLLAVPDMVLNGNLTKFYLQHAVNSPSLRPLTIDVFATLLPHLLDPNIFNSHTPISWTDQTYPTKSWIKRLWQYIEDEIPKVKDKESVTETRTRIRNQLNSIDTWCIFPAKNGCSNCLLYPLQETAKLLNMESVNAGNVFKTLTKMNVPLLDQETLKNNKIASILVASWDRPGAVLFVLSEMSLLNNDQVNESEMDELLYYFSRNLAELSSECDNPRERLMKLPFYPSLIGTFVPLRETGVVVVKSSSTIPKNGLKEWMDQTGITLIKENAMLDKLYSYINHQPVTPPEAYASFLIPHFHCIPSDCRPIHIECIRDRILIKGVNADYSNEQNNLIRQMNMLEFIETTDGTLHRACDFYSPREIVFSTMCPPSSFPPYPYDKNEWHSFLVLIGLQTEVTVDHFIAFVKEVERLGAQGISKDVAHKSEVLTHHLSSRGNKLEGILHRIRDIKFLLPFIVKEQHRHGKTLTQVHPQLEEAKCLVCYSESVAPRHCYITWTSKTMFAEHCDPANSNDRKNSKVVYAELAIDETPTADSVIKHIQNVSDSIAKLQSKLPIQSNLIAVLKEVMIEVYSYFQKHDVTDTVRERLDSKCTILLPDERMMVAAMQVVTTLGKEEAIPGYIYSGPLYFGQFFSVFHQLGAAKNVEAKHFALVLCMLKDEVRQKEMHANELNVAKAAMEKMFFYLQKEKESKTTSMLDMASLFLPSQSKIMTNSKELVFSDNMYLKKRVSSIHFDFFVGFKNMEMSVINPRKTISLLPEKHRPPILTDIVKEVISNRSKQMSHNGPLSQEISQVLETPEFVYGLTRLINHTRIQHTKEPLNQSECEMIEKNMQSIKIFEVENLQSVLSYDGHTVDGSETSSQCLIERTEDEVGIYISTKWQSKHIEFVYQSLSDAIDELTGFQLGRNTSRLISLFTTIPAEIGNFLDSCYIIAFEYLSGMFSKPVFPLPGTIIPEKFHFMLDNSFGYFTPGEYAGYEVYDSLIDEDVDDESQFRGGVFIVYVKIKTVVTQGENPLLGRYIIEEKDGKTKEVSAIQLYKFIREKKNICSDLQLSDASADSETPVTMDIKEVLKEIRKTLKDAWALLNEKDRNRVKKRLYLKWHPDKNPDRMEFCNEVCKYIAIYVSKLEKGLDIEESDDDVSYGAHASGESYADFSWFYHFDARSKRQRDYQHDYENTSQRGSSGRRHGFNSWFEFEESCHQSARVDPHPNHLEANRWFRQAKADLAAASDTTGHTTAFNWICLMSQHAAEKALKAMWYNKDANHADGIRHHDICRIASGLGHPVLTDLVSRLQSIIQDFKGLCYPDRLNYPRIPADVYTATDATQAFELAGEVITFVSERLS